MKPFVEYDLLKQLFYRTGGIRLAPVGAPFILASGKKSEYYIDCRKVVLTARGAATLGSLFFEMISDRLDELPEASMTYIGAIGVGGASLLGAIMASFGHVRMQTRAFVVRDTVKEHGTKQDIEGHLPTEELPGLVFLVEDVITSGGSILEACHKVEDKGHIISGIFGIVDREAGGILRLQQAGYYVDTLLTAKGIMEAKPG